MSAVKFGIFSKCRLSSVSDKQYQMSTKYYLLDAAAAPSAEECGAKDRMEYAKKLRARAKVAGPEGLYFGLTHCFFVLLRGLDIKDTRVYTVKCSCTELALFFTPSWERTYTHLEFYHPVLTAGYAAAYQIAHKPFRFPKRFHCHHFSNSSVERYRYFFTFADILLFLRVDTDLHPLFHSDISYLHWMAHGCCSRNSHRHPSSVPSKGMYEFTSYSEFNRPDSTLPSDEASSIVISSLMRV